MKSIGELSVLSKEQNLQLILEEERTQEFYYKVKELKTRLPKLGRCSICTLKIPCSHFSSAEEQNPITPEIEPTSKISALVDGLKSSTLPLPQLELQKDRSFSVRYRGPETKFGQIKQERHASMPNSKKLKILEQIEAYREEKIKKEIERIKKQREEEFRREMEEKQKDEKRRKYAKELRNKIEGYKDAYSMKKEQVKIMMEEDKRRRLNDDEKRKEYLNKRKEELAEYRNKKFVMEQIARQKMMELQKDFSDKRG